jgi:hypothetical protein
MWWADKSTIWSYIKGLSVRNPKPRVLGPSFAETRDEMVRMKTVQMEKQGTKLSFLTLN